MKWIKCIAASLFMLSFAVACEKEGPNGPSVDEGGNSELVLSASASEIFANGKDAVTFTVKYQGMSVVATVKEVATGKVVENTGFTATEAGEYSFKAYYKDFESNVVTVSVLEIPALLLEVDKKSILNDGQDICTFTVTNEGNDVTNEAVIKCMTTNTVFRETNTWYSNVSGIFEFRATLEDGNTTMVSNVVKVQVEFPDMSNPLELKVDKARITPNGSDEATFTVFYEGQDVTSDAKIKNTQTGDYLDGNTFSYSGSEKYFTFQAEYDGNTSFGVNVGFGDFYKKVLLIRFTGTWCGPCTLLGGYLKTVEEQLPDSYAQICVHSGDDPFVVADGTQYERAFYNSAVPRMYFDFSETGMVGASPASDIINRLKTTISQNPAKVGIAAKSVIDGDTINVEVRVTAQEAGEYNLTAVLIEDGLYGPQSGTDGYIHNDVFRGLLTPSINGEPLGSLEENQEVVKTFSVNKKGITSSDNIRILFYVNTKRGITTYTTNAATCPAYGYLDYKFAE